jgi:oligopeptide transport system permease protein
MVAGVLTGGFVVESIFAVPGLGATFVNSINSRDYNIIMGTTLFLAVLVIFMNLICDILYKIVDPRINLEK